MQKIKAFTRSIYTQGDYPGTNIFVEYFKSRHKDTLLGVVFYGSCLSKKTMSDTSFLDFYLIADEYKTFHKKWIHSKINSLLPPAVFYLELEDNEGKKQRCKYCVITIEDLELHTSHRAKDLYHLGRFSKRIAILYSQQDWVTDRIVDIAANAWQVLTPYAIVAGSSEIGAGDFAKSLLALSYHGEERLENTKQKVDNLYESAKTFYDQALGGILAIYAKNNRDQFKVDENGESHRYMLRRTPAQRAKKYKALSRLIKKSRQRAKMRWPFMMFTVDRWVDILLAKLERTYGTKLELTPLERRFILIFGWRHYFRLKREGKVK